MFVHLCRIILKFLYVCQSAIWLTSLLKSHKYKLLQFWMRYISEIYWRHSWDFDTLFPNNSDFFMSVSLLVGYFVTEIRQIWGYLHFQMRYIFEIFWRHSWDVCTLIQNNSEFLVCLSVCQFVTSLLKLEKIWGYLHLWMRFLSEIFFDILGTLVHQFLLCLAELTY